MPVLSWKILFESHPPLTGSAEVTGGAWHLAPSLPGDRIVSAELSLPLETAPEEKLFFNGYQTWTSCPERTGRDRLPGVPRYALPLVRYYGMDRYGDYFFVDYPNRPGILHGESWCYFRLGQRYRLIASLDERPGYTLFCYDANRGLLRIRRDCAGLRPAGTYPVFDLFFAEGEEDAVFDAWFAAMGIRPRTTERLAGYSSWYNRYQNISQQSIRADLAGCAPLLRPGDLFQIDDGWEPAVGDWLETDRKKFPDGLKPLADEIHGRWLKAGLWLAPFVCQRGSSLLRAHPEWLYRHEGKPWYCGCNWGGFYALDIDHPGFAAYLEQCFDRVLNDWGFDLVKLDFLYAAAPFGSAEETRAGRMQRAMELLRRLCGEKLILGCGVPLMPSFGLVDYCRVGCDVGLDWNNNFIVRRANREVVSTKNAIYNSVFRRQLNGRAFLNDPDVFFLRDDNLRLTAAQKHTLATVNSLFGGVLLCSDDMSRYSGDARAQYAQLLKNRDAEALRVEADAGLSVRYRVGGEEKLLVIE